MTIVERDIEAELVELRKPIAERRKRHFTIEEVACNLTQWNILNKSIHLVALGAETVV